MNHIENTDNVTWGPLMCMFCTNEGPPGHDQTRVNNDIPLYMLRRGYSFALHRQICNCRYAPFMGTLTRQQVKPIVRTLRNDDCINAVSDANFDWMENPKQMARLAYRRKRSRQRIKYKRFKPQSGVGFSEAHDIYDIFSSNLLRMYAIYRGRDLSSFVMVVLDMFREHLPSETMAWIKEITRVADWSQYTLEDITNSFKTGLSNWARFKENSMFPLVSEIANLICILVFSPSEFIGAIKSKYSRFTSYLSSYSSQATNILEWIVKIISSVVAAMKVFKETGDVVEAFCPKTSLQRMSELYDSCAEAYLPALNGSLDGSNIDFVGLVDDVIAKIEEISNLSSLSDARTATMYVDRLRTLRSSVLTRVTSRRERIQPYAFTMTGGTGVGKSNLSTSLMTYILELNNYTVTPGSIATINFKSKHWDNVYNDTIGYKFDDPDFLKAGLQDGDYLPPIARVLNTEQYMLEKADLSEKGQVFCNCKVAALTSNNSEYGAAEVVKEPGAFHRRFQMHLEVSVKEEYCKLNADGTRSPEMNSDLVKEIFGTQPFPDIYWITIYVVQVRSSARSKYKTRFEQVTGVHQSDAYCFVPAEFNGRLMERVGVQTMLAFAKQDSMRWFELQKQLLEERNSRESYNLCDTCRLPRDKCICGGGLSVEGSEMTQSDFLERESLEPQYAHSVDHGDLVFGRVPKPRAEPGGYPCFACNRGFAPNSVWAFMTAEGTKCVCRSCLASTRVNCSTCMQLPFSQVGMKKPPTRTIVATRFCKACTLAPEAGELDAVKIYLERLALKRRFEEDYKSKLSEVLKSYWETGTCRLTNVFNFVDGALMGEAAYFLEQCVSDLLSWLYNNGWCDWENWLPVEFEGTPAGTYLHIRYGKVGMLLRYDVAFTTGVLAAFGMYNVTRRPIAAALIGSALLATKGHPISYCAEVALSNPRIMEVLAYCRRGLSRLRKFRWNAKTTGAMCAFGMLAYLCPERFAVPAILLCISQLDRDPVGVGQRFSAIYRREKETHPLPIRDEILPYVMKATIAARLALCLGNTCYMIRYNAGVMPQAGEVKSIEDLASLSGMARYWYKKSWHDVNLDPLPVNKTCQPSELHNIVCKNLLHVHNKTSGESCDAFAITSKLIMVPMHFISKARSEYVFTRKEDVDGMCGNARFKAHISFKDVRYLGGDLVLLDLPKAGDFKDMTDCFLNNVERVPSGGLMIYRRKDGVVETNSVYGIRKDLVTNNFKVDGKSVLFQGLAYQSQGTGPCRCMSPIVCLENPSAILGFHLGGNTNNVGVSCLLTRDDVMRFKSAFGDSASFMVVPESGNFKQQQYGVNCIIQGVHPNSVAAAMGDGEYKLFGSTGVVSKDSENIIQTPIAEDVRRIMGCDKVWAAPKLEGYGLHKSRKQKWIESLDKSTNTAEMIPRDILDKAVDDYLSALVERVKASPPRIPGPLSDEEVINGVDGEAFLEKMEPSTSIGFPLSGPKRKWMGQYYNGREWKYQFTTSMFEDEARRGEKEYLEGRRIYPVYKTFPKIEPTDVNKDKVRLVNGAPVHKQIIMRKYVLPILKYLSENKDVSECAVGINPYGLEWTDVYRRLFSTGGRSRSIALDYKSYDLKMTSQLVGCAFKVIEGLAKAFGHTEEYVSIIRGLAADTMWPTVCVNGDIIMLVGSTVSGHNATAYINSIINSILMRVVFYTVYPDGVKYNWFLQRQSYKFRDAVTLYTYGDDLIGSVNANFGRFDNRAIVEVLGRYEFVLTAFDKSPKVKQFYSLDEIEFLKRKFVWNRITGCFSAPLAEASIFKRLSCIHKPHSPNTMETVLPGNIESALMEWFFYGPATYKRRQRQLIEVVDRISDPILQVACRGKLTKSYDDRLVEWVSLYK